MKKLIVVFIFLFFSVAVLCDEEPIMQYGQPEVSSRTRGIANQHAKDIRDGGLRYKTDRALDAMIKLATYKLHRIGKHKEANQILKEWKEQYEFSLLNMRGIGAHAPLSQWLSDKYLQLQFLLGIDVMKSLRLVDIYKLNHCIPVVVACIDNVDLNEYRAHFIEDEIYGWALGPIIVYWTSFFSCVGGTWGTGFVWCAPISMGAEYVSGRFALPSLNEPLYKLACNKGE